MTACLLAKIFGAEITTWDHPEILDLNPNLSVQPDYPIFVARRVLGSSSTYSVTHYLRAQCPDGWPESMTSSEVEWHPSTNPCDGSDLMTSCIKDNEGAIGYLDAAHGHEEILTEISLKNGDGLFVTSKAVGVEGVQAAVDLSLVPTSADEDFSEVAFYNKASVSVRDTRVTRSVILGYPDSSHLIRSFIAFRLFLFRLKNQKSATTQQPGANTWPITLVSYVYIRKDLSFIKNPARRTLLKAFATSLFDPDYIGLCERYGLVPVPTELRELSLVGLDMLELDASVSDEWTFEKDTIPGSGQGDRVISSRRQNFGLYEADRLADDLAPLIEEVRQLRLEVASLQAASALSSSGVANRAAAALGLVVLAGTAIFN